MSLCPDSWLFAGIVVFMILVKIDSHALVKVAERAEICGKHASRKKLAEGCHRAEFVVVAICNYGKCLAGGIELVTFAKILALGNQFVELRFCEVICHWLAVTRFLATRNQYPRP